MLCPACVAEMPEEDLFCENCGLKLGESAPQTAGCPCGELDEDGYCLSCGRRAHGLASLLAEAFAAQPIQPTILSNRSRRVSERLQRPRT